MFSTERRKTKGKWDIHLPEKKNQQQKQANKEKEIKKQSTNTGPTFLRLFRETAPFQSHGDTEDIF